MGAFKTILIDISDEFYRYAKRSPTHEETLAVWKLYADRKLTVRQCVRIALDDASEKEPTL